jgi:hypothetical protein
MSEPQDPLGVAVGVQGHPPDPRQARLTAERGGSVGRLGRPAEDVADRASMRRATRKPRAELAV